MGACVDRAHQRQEASAVAEPRRLAAERYLYRRARAAHRLGAAFVPWLLAARAKRTPAAGNTARGARDDDGALLGPRRRRYAEASVVNHSCSLQSACALLTRKFSDN